MSVPSIGTATTTLRLLQCVFRRIFPCFRYCTGLKELGPIAASFFLEFLAKATNVAVLNVVR